LCPKGITTIDSEREHTILFENPKLGGMIGRRPLSNGHAIQGSQ
jgi:hypothetical protein